MPEVILKRLPVPNRVGLVRSSTLLIGGLEKVELLLFFREQVFSLLGL